MLGCLVEGDTGRVSLGLAEPKGVRTGVSEGWAPRTLDTQDGKLEAGSSSGVRAICSYLVHLT